MWDTSQRLLRLLGLLQNRREWNAEQLAGQLGVTVRTVRRDVARLRDLGYPVSTVHGAGGGYHLDAGCALPPLMFETGEAIVTLFALRESAAADPATSDLALSALDKLSRAMPPRLGAAVDAISGHSSHLDLGMMIGGSAGHVAVATLVLLARACREERKVTCSYLREDGESGVRSIEPLHLVRTMGRWYLLAYCSDAGDWRTFRVDRISDPAITRHPSPRREPPAADLHAYVTAQVRIGMQKVIATVRVHAPRDEVADWILPAWGTVTEETARTCIVHAGADSYPAMARWLLLLDSHLTVIRPPELRAAFAELSARAARIAEADTGEAGTRVRTGTAGCGP